MSESEARTFDYTRSPEPAPKPQAEHEVELREIAQRQSLEKHIVQVFGSTVTPRKAKKRQHKDNTTRLYARLCEVPRNVSLEKATQMYDRAHRPFPVPKHLRDGGWPDTWSKAWKDKDGGFRKRLSDLRQCAWRWKLAK